jgi:hypothetical protein
MIARMTPLRSSRTPAIALAAGLLALAPVIVACGGSSGGGATTHAAATGTTSASAGSATGSATTTSGATTAGTSTAAVSSTTTGHTVFCGTVAGQPWSTNGETGDQWDISAMGVACATATHWVAVLSTQNAQVLNGPTGYTCDAQVVSSTVRPIAGSCQSAATSSQNFTWQAGAY